MLDYSRAILNKKILNDVNLLKLLLAQTDIELKTLWLSNTLRLLHCLKQYSGEEQFQVGGGDDFIVNIDDNTMTDKFAKITQP